MKRCLIRSSAVAAGRAIFLVFLITACQKQSENAPASSGGSSSGGASSSSRIENNDSMITAKVKAALLKNRLVKSMDVHVDTDQGEVTLSGVADSAEQIDQAVKTAEKIEGVRKVTNRMTIKKS